MPERSPEEAELIVRTVVRRYHAHCWWRDEEEMLQDAYLAVEEARNWYDPQVGVPWEAYAKKAVAFALKRKLWGASFAAYVPERHQREAAKTGAGRGVSLVRWDDGGEEPVARAPKSLQALFDPPSLLERRRWKQRVAVKVMEALVPEMGEAAALVIPVLTGEESAGAVALRLCLPKRRIHKLTCRARFILRGSRELRELWKDAP